MKQDSEKNNDFASELQAAFEKVRSEADCLDAFTCKGLFGEAGLDRAALDLLLNVCLTLRTKGMALEPNLIGRAAARNILDRRLAGIASGQFAARDTDFLEIITAADAARERAEYGEAKSRYFQALQMFPFHPGYMLQYGHCLKQLKFLPEALIAYLDAYRFGAAKQEFEIHALDTARLLGRFEQVAHLATKISQPNADKPPTPRALELTSNDVIILTQLFHLTTPSPEDIVSRMCECQSRRELVLVLLNEPPFSKAHRKTLELVAETGL